MGDEIGNYAEKVNSKYPIEWPGDKIIWQIKFWRRYKKEASGVCKKEYIQQHASRIYKNKLFSFLLMNTEDGQHTVAIECHSGDIDHCHQEKISRDDRIG